MRVLQVLMKVGISMSFDAFLEKCHGFADRFGLVIEESCNHDGVYYSRLSGNVCITGNSRNRFVRAIITYNDSRVFHKF